MAGRWALSICIFVQVGVIIALELTLRLSQSHNGLADVSTDGYLPYTWSVLPAFILSSIALAYTNMVFYTKVFAPYCALKSTASPSTTFLVNYLDKAELLCLWRAARLKHHSGKLSLYGGLIGTNPTAPNGTDTYFAVLVGGKNGFPISELADPALDDTIAARIRNQNGLIRAQEYNTQGRIAASGEVAARKLSGMATDPYRTPLVQNIVSTRVVQCLLGVMGVLAIISYLSMDSRQVLPKNPCSIAGVASMSVDSEILNDDTILALAWLESDRKLRKAGILDRRYTAKLGWFDPKNTRQSAEQPTAVDNAVRHTIRRKPTPSAMKRFGVDLIKRDDKTAESSELIP